MGDTNRRYEPRTVRDGLTIPAPPGGWPDIDDFNDCNPPCQKLTAPVGEREALDAIVRAILGNPRWRPSGKRRRIAIACVYSTHAGGDMHHDDHAIDATADDLDIKRRLVEELVAWAGAKLDACRTERGRDAS